MKKKKEGQTKSEAIANKSYEPSDYKSNDETAKGLAMTHEQVSDAYTEGTIDGKIDEVDKKGNLKSHDGDDLSNEGYE
ncbi:YozQ family protein [Evansella sp. AB-P1]|uniref:YozQ family protein n=1 Tax=Evansella sp. AB-P1 TaxID=3037653 RepID=UPI00241E00CC|nr:YozQ family protein [Evansella sp. AB-P1]MDG5788953.1 YozQ family protein [Evansella sp. AB-P1]